MDVKCPGCLQITTVALLRSSTLSRGFAGWVQVPRFWPMCMFETLQIPSVGFAEFSVTQIELGGFESGRKSGSSSEDSQGYKVRVVLRKPHAAGSMLAILPRTLHP